VTGTIMLLYVAIKWIAYSLVCHVGRRWVAGLPPSVPRAAGLGTARLLLGFVFGIGIFLGSAAVVETVGYGFDSELLAYAVVYVPVRWIEWSLLALFFLPAARSGAGWLFGSSARDRLWRVTAIAVSCLADIPVLLALGGLPVGRICC
jgi:hypothetical protein